MRKDLKQMAGEHAAGYVKEGMIIGLGTGSTVAHTIRRLGAAVKEGLRFKGIPTSINTEELAKEAGIELTNLEEHPEIDLTIDGADEVDPNLDLIKGMGGALLREKIVAKASKVEIIVADESKLVQVLGAKTPVPVEVSRFGWSTTKNELAKLGCNPHLRKKGDTPFITDNDNYIIDCKFESIQDPIRLESELNCVTGAIENGLFLNIADKVIVAKKGGIEELDR